jgi:hypothetical protein
MLKRQMLNSIEENYELCRWWEESLAVAETREQKEEKEPKITPNFHVY